MAGDSRPGGGGASHFGLALQEYTHFTSPIRRYADVVVHRQLLQAIKSEPDQGLDAASTSKSSKSEPLMSHAELASAAEVMNERHRVSKRAQKECSDLYLLLLLHRYRHVRFKLLLWTVSTGCQFFMQSHVRGAVLTQGYALTTAACSCSSVYLLSAHQLHVIYVHVIQIVSISLWWCSTHKSASPCACLLAMPGPWGPSQLLVPYLQCCAVDKRRFRLHCRS